MTILKACHHPQSGTAFVSVLLYMFVITYLVISNFSVSILQFKMSTHFKDAEMAFQYAESALLEVESQIHETTLRGAGNIGSEVTYEFERVSSKHCGVGLYEVRVEARYASAMKKVKSVYLLPVYNKACPDIQETPRRLLWQDEISN